MNMRWAVTTAREMPAGGGGGVFHSGLRGPAARRLGCGRHGVLSVLLCALLWVPAGHCHESAHDWDDWPQDAAPVNDGALAFLSAPPSAPVHHHHNVVTLHPQSLVDGWISLAQCHDHLDPVARSEIVFGQGRTRALGLLSKTGIARAWVEGGSVQLVGVGRGARLCLEAETRALTANGDGTYSLHNGPYMRRFLDGYYPMHVSMEVRYAGTGLRLMAVRPHRQPGFDVREQAGAVRLDTWFEGRLRTELVFAEEPRSP